MSSRIRSLGAALAMLLAASVLTPGAFAQEESRVAGAKGPSADVESTLDSAIVWIDDKAPLRVPAIGVQSASERAARISARIRTAAADPSVSLESIRVVSSETGTQIVAGVHPLMYVTEVDRTLEGVPAKALAELHVIRIREAVQAFRDAREPRYLINRGLYALGATLLLIAAFVALRWARRRAIAFFERRYKSRIAGVTIKSVEFVEADRIWTIIGSTGRFVYALLVAVVVFVYLEVVLRMFPWTRGLATGLLGYLLDPLREIGLGAVALVPNLLFLAVLVLIARFALKAIRLYVAALEQGTVTLSGFEPEWAWPTYKIVRVAVIAFAVIVAYPYIPGSQSLAFKGVSLFVGVLFSLGSSSVIGNVLAGYTMVYRRAFKVGDMIEIDETIGVVEEIRVLVTHLRTAKNVEVVLPNAKILDGKIVNYSSISRRQGLILHTTVGIGYETPWRQVEAMLLQAAERTPGMLREPKPFVLQRALGDFAITYELNVYSDSPRTMLASYAALHRSILDLFNEYGVQIMTPAYEGDPETPKVVPKDQWYTAPAPPPTGTEG